MTTGQKTTVVGKHNLKTWWEMWKSLQMHLNKLTMFPKIEPKDNIGLQELGDLLLGLDCAKNDGGLSGLKVPDEPAFLKPLLVKLPDDLQERWQRHAYWYKVQKAADYPPFCEFATFNQEISQERNDPYLAIQNLDTRRFQDFVSSHLKISKHRGRLHSPEDVTLRKHSCKWSTSLCFWHLEMVLHSLVASCPQ